MTLDPSHASSARSEPDVPEEETPVREPSKDIGTGLGVFRGLLLMAIFYLAVGLLLWLAWHAWHLHSR